MKRPSSHGIVVAVVDATTLLGRDLRSVLSERAFPASSVLLFHSGDDEGLVTEDDEGAAYVAPLAPDALETARIAFLCGDAADTARFLSRRRLLGREAQQRRGIFILEDKAYHRPENGGPLLLVASG